MYHLEEEDKLKNHLVSLESEISRDIYGLEIRTFILLKNSTTDGYLILF